MNFHIITLFPEICEPYTSHGILGRAQEQKDALSVTYYNPRDYTDDPHRKVDDEPYGGGPGMVLKAEPVLRAWERAVEAATGAIKTVILSPRGSSFSKEVARTYAETYTDLVLICGRYEGIDARVQAALDADEVRVGEVILTGGELPALAILDASARFLPGVLGDPDSCEESRVAARHVYTRPPDITFQGNVFSVPSVLTAGDHGAIERWRRESGHHT